MTTLTTQQQQEERHQHARYYSIGQEERQLAGSRQFYDTFRQLYTNDNSALLAASFLYPPSCQTTLALTVDKCPKVASAIVGRLLHTMDRSNVFGFTRRLTARQTLSEANKGQRTATTISDTDDDDDMLQMLLQHQLDMATSPSRTPVSDPPPTRGNSQRPPSPASFCNSRNNRRLIMSNSEVFNAFNSVALTDSAAVHTSLSALERQMMAASSMSPTAGEKGRGGGGVKKTPQHARQQQQQAHSRTKDKKYTAGPTTPRPRDTGKSQPVANRRQLVESRNAKSKSNTRPARLLTQTGQTNSQRIQHKFIVKGKNKQ